MKRIAWITIILFLVAALFAGPSFAADEKRILFKVPVCFATVLPGLGTTITWVADRIETASGGTMKMTVYEPGKLVAPFEILDAVSTGKTNAGYSTAGYWAGKIPASPFFTAGPFGPEAGEYLAWLWHGNGMKLYQEMYDSHGYNVKVLVLGIIAPETSGWYKEPVKSIDEYNGLRIRFFGFGGDALSKLGASVSLIPGGEIFPALEKRPSTPPSSLCRLSTSGSGSTKSPSTTTTRDGTSRLRSSSC
jgi:TRAP-type mannitol/chloroaromatic compound transport system substrate-binding protein